MYCTDCRAYSRRLEWIECFTDLFYNEAWDSTATIQTGFDLGAGSFSCSHCRCLSLNSYLEPRKHSRFWRQNVKIGCEVFYGAYRMWVFNSISVVRRASCYVQQHALPLAVIVMLHSFTMSTKTVLSRFARVKNFSVNKWNLTSIYHSISHIR